MRSIVFLILTIPTLMARYTPEEIQAEVNQHQQLRREAAGMMQPLFDQMNEEKRRVRAPFDEQMQILRERVQPLQAERTSFDELRRPLEKRLGEDCYGFDAQSQAAAAASLDLRTELSTRRAPIAERVRELQASEQTVLQECYRQKADPVWGKWWDGTDSLGVAFRCAYIQEDIKKLYASVDGDLNERIEQTERSARERALIEHRSHQERLSAELEALKTAQGLVHQQIEALEHEMNILNLQAIDLTRERIPDGGRLLGELQQQIELGLVVGAPGMTL